MTERKMATIRRINKIEPIEGADKIVKATVGGWQLVTAIDNGFKEGDLVVYCEIDSWIPNAVAPFLSKGQEPREYEGIKGERLRTVKLRGQISQGLLLPIQLVFELPNSTGVDIEGTDVSEVLGIVKYEAPIPACLAGEVKGMFPSFIPKTDQERVQNLTVDLEDWKTKGYTFEQTEKLDGSSMTAYLYDDYFGVCSRNLDLKKNPDNSLWKAAINQNIEAALRELDGQYAFQGELIGEGIQKNPYKLKGQKFFVFDIYDIDKAKHLEPIERMMMVRQFNLSHVPVFATRFQVAGKSVADLLRIAEAKSVMGYIPSPEQEGNVYKCNEDPDISFKVISNKFLLKNED